MRWFYLHWPSTNHSPEHYWKNKQYFANKNGPLNLPRVVISLSPKLWNIWGLVCDSRQLVRLNYIQGKAIFFFLHSRSYLFCVYEDKLTFQRKVCIEVVLVSTFFLSIPFYFLIQCMSTQNIKAEVMEDNSWYQCYWSPHPFIAIQIHNLKKVFNYYSLLYLHCDMKNIYHAPHKIFDTFYPLPYGMLWNFLQLTSIAKSTDVFFLEIHWVVCSKTSNTSPTLKKKLDELILRSKKKLKLLP